MHAFLGTVMMMMMKVQQGPMMFFGDSSFRGQCVVVLVAFCGCICHGCSRLYQHGGILRQCIKDHIDIALVGNDGFGIVLVEIVIVMIRSTAVQQFGNTGLVAQRVWPALFATE